MKVNCLRVCLICLALIGAGAAMSSAIAYACLTDGCWTGCKVWAKWCNSTSDVGYDFGSTGVVVGTSCAINPDGGSPYNLVLRSYDVYGDCSSECPSDTLSPGTMEGERESTAQGTYYTNCNVGGP